MAWRFESGRWRSIRLLDTAEQEAARATPPGPAPPATDPDAAARDRALEVGEVRAEADGTLETAAIEGDR